MGESINCLLEINSLCLWLALVLSEYKRKNLQLQLTCVSKLLQRKGEPTTGWAMGTCGWGHGSQNSQLLSRAPLENSMGSPDSVPSVTHRPTFEEHCIKSTQVWLHGTGSFKMQRSYPNVLGESQVWLL